MADIQVFKIVDVMPAQALRDETQGGVRKVRLYIQGDAGLTSEVQVNGFLAPSFSALSQHYLDVTIPSVLFNSSLVDLEFTVLSSDRTPDQLLYEIRYGLGRISFPVSGSDVLVQKWIRYFLMSQGSDPYDREAGCGLMSLAGQVTAANQDDARATVARLHNLCTRQLLQRQESTSRRIPPRERLVDARLRRVTFDESFRIIVASSLVDGRFQVLQTQVRV